MKILIAGAGKVGSTLTRELCADGHEITVIDKSPAALESACELYDVLGISGNCASMHTLKDADVEHANILIAVTDADEINLLSCVTARKLNPAIHTVARIRNPEYADQVYDMREVFGLSLIVNPERSTAVKIARLLKFPGFLNQDSFIRGRVEIVELEVERGSKLIGVSMMNITAAVQCQVLVCAVLRDGKPVFPKGHFVIEEGDRLFVTASSEDLSALLQNLGIVTHPTRRAILCGGSRISYYLAQLLELSGTRTKIIDRNPEKCRELAALLPNTEVICGNVSDPEMLEAEDLASTDALVTLTGLDELNVLISLYGKSREVPQVITKQDHADSITDIVQSLSLGSIVSPKTLCCDLILRYLRALRDPSGETVLTVQTIAGGKVQASEFRIREDSLNRGKPLREMKIRKDVLIAAVSRGRQVEVAGGNTSFDTGDCVIVVSGSRDILRFNDIFE